ncbi:MAG: TRAP transporter small permease [Deltaproteobacteria bacterium]|nr:TRAP transporter small permease [Deltaproteobacteria bacterium]
MRRTMCIHARKYVGLISKHLNSISIILLSILAAVSILVGGFNVINRALLHYPLPWVDALIRYSLIWIIFLGFPVLVKKMKLISVDVFVSRLNRRAARFFNLLSYISICIFSVVVLIQGCKILSLPIVKLQTVATLGISKVWIYSSIPIGFAITLIHLIVLAWDEITGRV